MRRYLFFTLAIFSFLTACRHKALKIEMEYGTPIAIESFNREGYNPEYKDTVEYYMIVKDSATNTILAKFPQKEKYYLKDYLRKLNFSLMTGEKVQFRMSSFYQNCEISSFFDSALNELRFPQNAKLNAVNFIMAQNTEDDEHNTGLALSLISGIDLPFDEDANQIDFSSLLWKELIEYYDAAQLDTLENLKEVVYRFDRNSGVGLYRILKKGKVSHFTWPMYCSFLSTQKAIEYISKNKGNPYKRFYVSNNFLGEKKGGEHERVLYLERRTILLELDFHHDSKGKLKANLRLLNPISCGYKYNEELPATHIVIK